VESPVEPPPEELTRLRDTLNELRDILARPALWAGGAPPLVAQLSMDTLFGIASELEERVAERARALVAAHEALRESERNSRLVVDSIPGLVALLTPAGQVEFVNRQILEYTGQTLAELNQWGTNGTVHHDDLSHVIEVFTRSIGSGSPYEIIQRLRRCDGIYRWFQNSGFPLRDPDGRIVRWCVLLTDVDERRRTEDALRERERELRLIVDTIPGLIAVFSADGALESANPQLCAYFGMSLEELAQWQELGNTTHPDDRERAVATFLRATELGEPFDLEVRSPRADGVYVWLHSRGVPLRDSSGQIVRWYNLLTDIDERKRAEEALRLSERNLQLIIDAIPALVWSARPDGGAEFFNRHYQDFVGLSEEEARDWGWTAAVYPDDVKGLAATWQRIMASQAPGEAEARLRRHDGAYRWFLFRANPIRDESGAIVKWYGVNTDIEDRKRAEQELRRSEAFLLEGQRLARMGNILWNLGTGDISWTEEVYRMFEFEPGTHITLELIGSRVHPEDIPMLFDMVERAQRAEEYFEYEHRLLFPNQSVKHLHLIAHRSSTDPSRPEYVGAVYDVTRRRLAEEAFDKARSELAHVARVATLSTLTASIAHEVNQPLSGIVTNAGTCLRMLDADPPNVEGARETARRAIRDGHRASDVIARLRALFSRKEFTLESLDLNEAILEVIALSRSDLQRSRVVLQSELADSLPTVTGDRIQLQQVILNLLRNASDAMVDVHDRPRQLLIKTDRKDDDRVLVSVRDAGVGIEPQSMEKLFDAFYTTKTDGMGIGLSISRSIIERHRGRLWAEPNDGPGATFRLSIPCTGDGVAVETA
jgi:PAS domain S-box-containing protein